MVIEFDYFTLVNLRGFGDATLSLKMKLISPEITTWIETKQEQTILTSVHNCEVSFKHDILSVIFWKRVR